MAIVAMHACGPTEERVPGNAGRRDREGGLLRSAICVTGEAPIFYEPGDIPCARDYLRIDEDEHMEIRFRVTDENATDRYDYGYHELLRYRNGRVIETLGFRRASDLYWYEVHFVRIRRQEYLADLDGDGQLEFAVLPYDVAQALWRTARIYSLKDRIEPWGEGSLPWALDTFVQLDCRMCSDLRPEECEKCR